MEANENTPCEHTETLHRLHHVLTLSSALWLISLAFRCIWPFICILHCSCLQSTHLKRFLMFLPLTKKEKKLRCFCGFREGRGAQKLESTDVNQHAGLFVRFVAAR